MGLGVYQSFAFDVSGYERRLIADESECLGGVWRNWLAHWVMVAGLRVRPLTDVFLHPNTAFEQRGLWTHALQGLVVSVLEHLKDVLDQGLFDFSMAWDRLADTRSRVLIPIVPSTVSNEDAAVLLDLTNEVAPLHDTCSSATRRTSGMLPLVSS